MYTGRMKIIKVIVALVLILFIGLVLARNVLIRSTAESVLARELGADVVVRDVHTSIWRSEVILSGIEVVNSDQFPGESAFEVEEIRVTYRLGSLFSDTVHLPELVLDVRRIMLGSNENTQATLQRLLGDPRRRAPVDDEPTAGDHPAREPDPERVDKDVAAEEDVDVGREAVAVQETAARDVHIDQLTIRLGAIELREWREEGDPIVRNYILDIDREFSNVREMDEVVRVVGMDVAVAMGPQLIREALESDDLQELGRQMDEDTKELQRELRDRLRSLRGRDQ